MKYNIHLENQLINQNVTNNLNVYNVLLIDDLPYLIIY